MKMQSEAVLAFYFIFCPPSPLIFYLQGDLDQFQLKHQSVYWRGGKKRAMK